MAVAPTSGDMVAMQANANAAHFSFPSACTRVGALSRTSRIPHRSGAESIGSLASFQSTSKPFHKMVVARSAPSSALASRLPRASSRRDDAKMDVDDDDKRVKEIVVVGGGTAGWMAAAYLGKALQGSVSITVLDEAADIPMLGVGEGSLPNLQSAFFDFLGIAEEEWMVECNGSYKMAVKFINWRTPGAESTRARMSDDGRVDNFYHNFGDLPRHDQLPLSTYWVEKQQAGRMNLPFDYACYQEPPAMDLNKAPRRMDGTRSTAAYAWHFDEHLLADYLRRHATSKLGVCHIEDRLERAELRPGDGHIQALHTASGRMLRADLFVDCSGFHGQLINTAIEEPLLDMNNHLLCNSAVASAVPYDDAKHGVEPYTSAIAMKSGWTSKIPMAMGRFGTGYIYSSQFCSSDEAAIDFCRLWGLNPDTAALSEIKFRVGRNRRAWVRNCVSIGAASCFLEPLESTGVYFISSALYQLVEHFPDKDFQPGLVAHFNSEIEYMFDDSLDFLQAHYYLSPRVDTPFWQASKELALGESIAAKIEAYRGGLAINAPTTSAEHAFDYNCEQKFRNFWTNNSYYCLFTGLGLLPDSPLARLQHMPASVSSADEVFEQVQKQQKELICTLPSCYNYLSKMHGRTGCLNGMPVAA